MSGIAKTRHKAEDKKTVSGRAALPSSDVMKRRKEADRPSEANERPKSQRGPAIDVDVVIDSSSPALDDLVSLLGMAITTEYFDKKKTQLHEEADHVERAAIDCGGDMEILE